jgi:carbon storage regulator
MLVLTRRLGQRIVIGNDIAVTIVGVYGKTVRVAVDAPAEVTVLRTELTSRGQALPQAVAGGKQ